MVFIIAKFCTGYKIQCVSKLSKSPSKLFVQHVKPNSTIPLYQQIRQLKQKINDEARKLLYK